MRLRVFLIVLRGACSTSYSWSAMFQRSPCSLACCDDEEPRPLQYTSRAGSYLSGFHDSVYDLGNDSALPQRIEGRGGGCLHGRCTASDCLLADFITIGNA